MEHSWWLTILGGLALLWALSLLAAWGLTRKRLLKELARQEAPVGDAALHLTHPRPGDAQALEVIRSYRRRLFTNLRPGPTLSYAAVNETAQNLIRDIAKVYYPEEERPELKASLADLVGLVNRVGSRLNLWLNTLPMRSLKDLEIGTVLRYHDLYQQVVQHPAYCFLKRYHLDKAARWLWTAKNLLNPWYWGRRLAYSGGREVVVRLFLAQVVSLVGEEARRIYGRHQPAANLRRRLHLALQEMINLSLENGLLPPQVQTYLLRLLLKTKGLDDQDRLSLIALVAHPQVLDPPPDLDTSDRRYLAARLKHFTRCCWQGPEQDRRLALIKNRWSG